jgi:hypothetical protein
MNSGKQRSLFYLSMLWAAALSLLTSLTLPKQFLTADVLIQSVMSLQKVTLYYWGQNRLINVLPLSVAWITEPKANLTATLWLSSMCLFLLLLALSRFAAAAVNASKLESLSLKTFVLTSTAFLYCFTPHAIFDITIAHFEYALPALLLAIAVNFSVLRTGWSLRPSALCAVAVFLAIGVNPATVLPGVFIAAAAALYRKRIGKAEAFLAGTSLLSYLSWSLIAGLHGDSNYATFDPALLPTGVGKIIPALVGTVNPVALVLLLGALALGRLASFAFSKNAATCADESFEYYLRHCALVFAIAWLLLFSGNHWVEASLFSWRYFIYVLFAGLFCLALSFANGLDWMGRKSSSVAAVGAVAMSLASAFSEPVAVEDYKVFRETRPFTQLGSHLYAGDYWLVWPSVLGDMMQGHEAYGLAFRGEANRAAIRKYVLQAIDRDGHVSVLCLNDRPQACRRQIDFSAGNFQVSEATLVREKAYEFKLSRASGRREYMGKAFLDLPSQVGLIADGVKKSNGSPGFLAFGPYASLDAGSYRLDVFGSSGAIAGAFADVTSSGGHKVYAKFNLQPGAGEVLLRDGKFSIPKDAYDVEVRVWVGEGTRLDLKGYRLDRR